MADELPPVTCDLFSALVDSRSGACAALAALSQDWPVTPAAVYDRWDAISKTLQRECTSWVPFAELSRRALVATYDELAVPGSAEADIRQLLDSVGNWPLWPDVERALPGLQAVARVGVLSNVDDDVFRATRVAPLVDPGMVLTSQRLQAYKPGPLLYMRGRDVLGPFLHVASSARDVRGALEAGVAVVRLRRPGHRVDPAGPAPAHEVDSLAQVAQVLGRVDLS